MSEVLVDSARKPSQHETPHRDDAVGGQSGTDDNSRLSKKMTAMDIWSAIRYGQVATVDEWIAGGGDPGVQDTLGRTPLHVAVDGGTPSIVEMLLGAEADVNAPDHDGLTPLHIAAHMGVPAIVEMLLANGADLEAEDCHGRTPYHVATDQWFNGWMADALSPTWSPWLSAQADDGAEPSLR